MISFTSLAVVSSISGCNANRRCVCSSLFFALISYAYLASDNVVVAVDDSDDDALAMSSNKVVVFLSVDDDVDVVVVNARSTVLLFVVVVVVWEEDFVGFLRLAFVFVFFFFPLLSSPFALVVVQQQLVGRGTARISLSLSLSLVSDFSFSKKKSEGEKGGKSSLKKNKRIIPFFLLLLFLLLFLLLLFAFQKKHAHALLCARAFVRSKMFAAAAAFVDVASLHARRRRFSISSSSSPRRFKNNNNNIAKKKKKKKKKKKTVVVVVQSKGFDFLPNSLLPSESFSAETTTFLDVSRGLAKRLRAAKELHPTWGREKQIIVGIAGPPGGGKSTLAKQVSRQFRKLQRNNNNNNNNNSANNRNATTTSKEEEDEEDEEEDDDENENENENDDSDNEDVTTDVVIVPMDGYHYYRHQLEKMDNPQHAFAKRGAPFTFDSERFVQDIVNLRKTGSGSFPSFDHGKGDPVENDILVDYKRHKIVLVEGNYLFLGEQPWARLLDENCFDETWYVNCPVNEATKRVIDRHIRTGKTKEAAELRAYSNDMVNAKLVDANKRFTDLMIPNAKKWSRNSSNSA